MPLRELPRVTWEALPALMMPVILLGCLYSGITTPTEAAAVAALYALLVSALLYRSIGWGDVYVSLTTSARITISIGMLIAGALVFNYVITVENIPKTLAAMLKGYELSPLAFLLIANLLLLVLGCFLEGTTILLIIVPVLLPDRAGARHRPGAFRRGRGRQHHDRAVTPPYGLLLFMMVKIAEVPLRDLVREVMPFLVVMIGALALITLVPGPGAVPAAAAGLQRLSMLGKAAVAMWWDIAPKCAPSGRTGTRASTCPSGSASRASCAARAGSPLPAQPSYFVLYEVERAGDAHRRRISGATEQSDAVVAQDDAAPSQHGAQPVRGSGDLGRRGAADAGDDPFFTRIRFA